MCNTTIAQAATAVIYAFIKVRTADKSGCRIRRFIFVNATATLLFILMLIYSTAKFGIPATYRRSR